MSDEQLNKQQIAYTKLDAQAADRLDRRVVSLERNMEELCASIRQLRDSFQESTRELQRSFNKLSEDWQKSTRTNWPVALSTLAVALTLCAGLYVLVIGPMHQRLTKIEDNRISFEDPVQNARLKSIEQELDRLRNGTP